MEVVNGKVGALQLDEIIVIILMTRVLPLVGVNIIIDKV